MTLKFKHVAVEPVAPCEPDTIFIVMDPITEEERIFKSNKTGTAILSGPVSIDAENAVRSATQLAVDKATTASIAASIIAAKPPAIAASVAAAQALIDTAVPGIQTESVNQAVAAAVPASKAASITAAMSSVATEIASKKTEIVDAAVAAAIAAGGTGGEVDMPAVIAAATQAANDAVDARVSALSTAATNAGAAAGTTAGNSAGGSAGTAAGTAAGASAGTTAAKAEVQASIPTIASQVTADVQAAASAAALTAVHAEKLKLDSGVLSAVGGSVSVTDIATAMGLKAPATSDFGTTAGTIAEGNHTHAGGSGPSLSAFRNKLYNGNFTENQYPQPAGTAGTSGFFAERWKLKVTAGSVTALVVNAWTKSLKTMGSTSRPKTIADITQGTAGAGNEISQRIEYVYAWEDLDAVLSFNARLVQANATPLQFTVRVTDYFGASGSPAIVKTFPITIGPTAQTFVCKVPGFSASSVTPDGTIYTAGTYREVALVFPNSIFEIYINEVALYAGTEYQIFEDRPPEIERMLCQKYHFRLTSDTATWNLDVINCQNTSTTVSRARYKLPVTMVRAPTVTFSALGNLGLSNSSGTSVAVTAQTVAQSRVDAVAMNFTVASGLVTGGASFVTSHTVNAFIDFSAEI